MDMFEIDHDHCGPSLKSRVRFAPLVLKDDILDDRGSPGRVTPCGISLKINPTFATRGVEAAKLEVFRGVRSKGRHHTGRCHGAATSTEAILGDG